MGVIWILNRTDSEGIISIIKCAGRHLAWQPPPSVNECMYVCMSFRQKVSAKCECKTKSKQNDFWQIVTDCRYRSFQTARHTWCEGKGGRHSQNEQKSVIVFWQMWPLTSTVSSWSCSRSGCDEQLMEAVQELGTHMLQLAVNIH